MPPPTLRQLVANTAYKQYLRRSPKMPAAVTLTNPFQVWAYNSDTQRWGSALQHTYKDAFLKVRELFKSQVYSDLALVSRTILCPFPRRLKIDSEFMDEWSYGYTWCQRCRRPTTFAPTLTHRALRKAPVLTTDENLRCYHCGVRKCFAGEEMTS